MEIPVLNSDLHSPGDDHLSSPGSSPTRPFGGEPTGEAYDFSDAAGAVPPGEFADSLMPLPRSLERAGPGRKIPVWERLSAGTLRPKNLKYQGLSDAVPELRPPVVVSRRVVNAGSVPGMPEQPFGAPRVRKLVQPRLPPPEVYVPPPPSILDGFSLLAAAGCDEPERATVANMPGQNLVGVEAGDMPYFTSLAALDVSDNQLGSMGALAGLADLRELKLSCNHLCSLGLPPSCFACLRVLDCAYNSLGPEDLLPLCALPSLVWLDMTSNRVDVILPEICAGFAVLEVFSLGSQRPRLSASDLEPLAQLPRLRVLHLPSNAIASVPLLPPDAFPCLELLDMRSNAVEDTAAVAPLARCARLREVLLHGNPMADRPDLPRAGGVLSMTITGDVTLAHPASAQNRSLSRMCAPAQAPPPY